MGAGERWTRYGRRWSGQRLECGCPVVQGGESSGAEPQRRLDRQTVGWPAGGVRLS